MAYGVTLNGTCYESRPLAKEAFENSYPKITDLSVSTLNYANLYGNYLDVSITNKNLSTGAATTVNTGFSFPSCNYDSLSSMPVQDIGFVIAMVICCLIGFRMGQAA